MELNLEQNTDTDLSDGPNQRREPWIPALQMAEADVQAFLEACWFSSFLYCVGRLASPPKYFFDQINLCCFLLACLNNMLIIINSKHAVSRHFSWCFEMWMVHGGGWTGWPIFLKTDLHESIFFKKKNFLSCIKQRNSSPFHWSVIPK